MFVSWNLAATDNSGHTPYIVCDQESGSPFYLGETQVLCEAYDAYDNVGECIFIVEVTGKSHKMVVLWITNTGWFKNKMTLSDIVLKNQINGKGGA